MHKLTFVVLCLLWLALACGHETPLADSPVTEDPAPFVIPPAAGGEPVPDAGGPWAHCARHRKAKGHGAGLAKSCP